MTTSLGRLLTGAGVLLAGLWIAVVFWAMNATEYAVWGSLLVLTVVVVGTVPMAHKLARDDGAPGIGMVLAWALIAKLLGTLARYAVSFVVYEGTADAAEYDVIGRTIAEGLWDGNLAKPERGWIGTGALQITTGFTYTLIGPTLFGAFVIFAWLGFWGQWMLYRAYRIAVPDGATRRYAVLILFLPSMVYWPASVGKEAIVLLGIGAAALGVARMSTHTPGWMTPLVAGHVVMGVIRPHMALIMGLGVFAAFLVRRPSQRTLAAPVWRVLGLAAFAGAGVLLMRFVANFFGVESLDQQGIDNVLARTQTNTAGGGSGFEANPVRSIQDFPFAMVSVLFRPFIWEAHNAVALVAAAESCGLIVLGILSWRRLAAIPRLVVKNPYVAAMVTSTITFVIAFSTFGNFGLLARERTMILGFVVGLLCLPAKAAPPVGTPGRDRRRPVPAWSGGAQAQAPWPEAFERRRPAGQQPEYQAGHPAGQMETGASR